MLAVYTVSSLSVAASFGRVKDGAARGPEVCVVCLRCGFFTAEEMRAELLQEEAILEVATSVLVRPGDAETLQRCLARVLRVEPRGCKETQRDSKRLKET